MSSKLNGNFLAEIFKLMFVNKTLMEICQVHLKYQLIPKELGGYKFILKEAVTQFERTSKLPSLGVIAQKFNDNEDVQEAIDEIKKASLPDLESVLDQLENYIKDTEFQILSKKVYDLYNEGKKEESIQLNAEESQRILSISLRETGGKFLKVFRDFKSVYFKNAEEYQEEKIIKKVPFGIDCLDDSSYGGADTELGDLVLWIMRSGVGKSTVLRWAGMSACLHDIPVLHIQLEGGAQSAFNKYSQIWTNQSYKNITRGTIPEEDWVKIEKTLEQISHWDRDIEIYSFEKFGEASVIDVRNLILEYHKIHGFFPKLIVIDSLDLLKTGENVRMDTDPAYIKYKLQKVSQLLKNIATEFKLVITTATQTSDVPMDVWNDADKVIDRSYTEGDKTLVKPFSFVLTGNMTLDEMNNNMARIYLDKIRDYPSRGNIYKIVTDYNKGRFYNKKATLELGESLVKTGRKSKEKAKKPERAQKI